MNFDKFWRDYEQKHGPQSIEMKDFAFLVYSHGYTNGSGDLSEARKEAHNEGYHDGCNE